MYDISKMYIKIIRKDNTKKYRRKKENKQKRKKKNKCILVFFKCR